MPTLAGTKQTFHPPLRSKVASFYRKCTDLIRQRWTSKSFFPRQHRAYKRNIVDSISGNIELLFNWENEKIYKIKVTSNEN